MAGAPTEDEAEPAPLWHPMYDVVGGLMLLGIGAISRYSSTSDADTLDYAFDMLAVVWLVAGLVRWGKRRAALAGAHGAMPPK